MLEFLQTGKALSVLAAIGTIGFVSKLITRNLYKRLLKETENMAMTKNRNLKILKQKLENAYRLNQNIVNTQAYLEKQLYGFKFMNISLNTWNNLSLQMTILGLLAGGIGTFMSYWYRLDSYYIILYASVGALGGLFLTFLDSSFNISLQQQRLSNSLLEYVDNSVFVRVARENSNRISLRERATAASMREEAERETAAHENGIRDGLVREDEPRKLAARTIRTRNEKAGELLRTVRNVKPEEEADSSLEQETGKGGQTPGRSRASSRSAAVAKETAKEQTENGAASVTDKNSDSTSRRDIDYLKHSLEQIAASKEKTRKEEDWAKKLDSQEIKVLGEIMRQYFAGD